MGARRLGFGLPGNPNFPDPASFHVRHSLSPAPMARLATPSCDGGWMGWEEATLLPLIANPVPRLFRHLSMARFVHCRVAVQPNSVRTEWPGTNPNLHDLRRRPDLYPLSRKLTGFQAISARRVPRLWRNRTRPGRIPVACKSPCTIISEPKRNVKRQAHRCPKEL